MKYCARLSGSGSASSTCNLESQLRDVAKHLRSSVCLFLKHSWHPERGERRGHCKHLDTPLRDLSVLKSDCHPLQCHRAISRHPRSDTSTSASLVCHKYWYRPWDIYVQYSFNSLKAPLCPTTTYARKFESKRRVCACSPAFCLLCPQNQSTCQNRMGYHR